MKRLVLQFETGQVAVHVHTQRLGAVQRQREAVGLPHDLGGLALTPLLLNEAADGGFSFGLDDKFPLFGLLSLLS